MKTTALSIICVLTIASVATAYELPEVIGFIEGHEPHRSRFAYDFCCVGDQNGDGCDDLMLSRDPYSCGEQGDDFTNTVEIYFGGDEMDDEPDVVFETDEEYEGIGWRIQYLGNLIPNCFPFFAIESTLDTGDPFVGFIEYRTRIYEGGDELDFVPEFGLTNCEEARQCLDYGRNRGQADLNGDGFHELILNKSLDSLGSRLDVFFGGGDFDTIPDWTYTFADNHGRISSSIEYRSGRDLNADGYDDILVRSYQRFTLFLGGEEMDTIPDLTVGFRDFDNRTFTYGFTLLPDVNGDGYDDWTLHYGRTDRISHGFYVFMGSEEPDLDVFVEFVNDNGAFGLESWVTGGDFNDDGYGDIVTCSDERVVRNGSMCIHFGSPWMEAEPDIEIYPVRDYGEEFAELGSHIGAVGDYNNDGVDDWVCWCYGDNDNPPALAIFAGNRDWEVGVEEEPIPETYDISLITRPNPFNSQVRIDYELAVAQHVRLAVYDIHGKLVKNLKDRREARGTHSLSWEVRTAGIYFVLLQAGDARVVRKVVCLP